MLIKKDFSLKPYNTFGLDVFAHRLAIIPSLVELRNLYNNGELTKSKVLILSQGSNILFKDNVSDLVLLNEIFGKEVIDENEENVILKVSSGESWPDLVEYTVDRGWGGLENMTDIPGKVGAAPIQNIGAYGAELKDVLISLEAFDMCNGELVNFTNKQCEFDYRSSVFKTKFKNRYFITSVLIKLTKNPKINLSYQPLAEAFAGKHRSEISLKEVSARISEIRSSKLPDPEKLNNAGSFFKNPIVNLDKLNSLVAEYSSMPSYPAGKEQYKIPAAWLIEQCGWKGRRVGDVGVYEKQALVLINYDKATGNEILEFANSIQKSVIEKFGVSLEYEVNVV